MGDYKQCKKNWPGFLSSCLLSLSLFSFSHSFILSPFLPFLAFLPLLGMGGGGEAEAGGLNSSFKNTAVMPKPIIFHSGVVNVAFWMSQNPGRICTSE